MESSYPADGTLQTSVASTSETMTAANTPGTLMIVITATDTATHPIESSTLTATPSTTSVPISSSETTSTSDAASKNAAMTGGLSTGAKAGIGVGVGVGVVLIILLTVLWFLRRRKKYPAPVNKMPSPQTSLVPELDGNALNELDGQSTIPPPKPLTPPAPPLYELNGNSVTQLPKPMDGL